MSDKPDKGQSSVAVLTRDLFFGMRIRNALKQLGCVALLLNTEIEFAETMTDTACALGLLDFNGEVDRDALARVIVARPDIPVIAFGPHTDTESFRKAREVGVARVISNGAFSRQLPDLVQRYAQRR